MSRIGKMPVTIPNGVKVEWQEPVIKVTAGKNALIRTVHPLIRVAVEKDSVAVKPVDDSQQARALWGLTRTLINNMVQGVSTGFTKVLEVVGVGWRVEAEGSNKLKLMLGFSNPLIFELPAGISAEVDAKTNRITLSGADKELVGETAAKIRAYRKPEPYKGKGIKYLGEYIQRKVGKAGGK